MTKQINQMMRASGGFAMLALDQRESLRQMMETSKSRSIRDNELVDFKIAALDVFSTKPSAVLLDIDFGIEALSKATAKLAPVILAVDELISGDDGRVAITKLVEFGIESSIEASSPVALKFLMLWSEMDSAAERLDLAGSFVELCKKLQLPSVLESIVRPKNSPTWIDPYLAADAMLQAAHELSAVKSDLYKCEVPGHGRFEIEETIKYSKEISQAIASPWVVLSNGVSAADFPKSVKSACLGGASGFLAGRAIWADAIQTSDPKSFMKSESINRMDVLIKIVDETLAIRHKTEASAQRQRNTTGDREEKEEQ